MADQFENQLPQKNDAKWVRALDASGNPILISKEDLASVVGGLLGINNTWHRYMGAVDKSFDEIKNSGTYSINKTTFPSIAEYPPSIIYGILVVFKAESWILQIASSIENANTYLRCSNEYGRWTDWRLL